MVTQVTGTAVVPPAAGPFRNPVFSAIAGLNMGIGTRTLCGYHHGNLVHFSSANSLQVE